MRPEKLPQTLMLRVGYVSPRPCVVSGIPLLRVVAVGDRLPGFSLWASVRGVLPRLMTLRILLLSRLRPDAATLPEPDDVRLSLATFWYIVGSNEGRSVYANGRWGTQRGQGRRAPGFDAAGRRCGAGAPRPRGGRSRGGRGGGRFRRRGILLVRGAHRRRSRRGLRDGRSHRQGQGAGAGGV